MIHPLSVIDPSAKIGDGVEIGPFVTIHGNVEIGDGTRIFSNVTIMEGARIGRNCTIFPGAVISAVPQDLKFHGEETLTIIGDNNVIRECVTIHRGTASKGKTVVGNNNLIMAYNHIAHDCRIGNNIIMSNCNQLAGEVVVDDFAVIGGGGLVHQFCHIGSYVMLQGGALVNKDVPPFIKAAREPLSFTGLNSVGLRRHNFTNEQIAEIQEVYRYLYQSDLNVTHALARIEAEMPASPLRDQIVEFVRNSERGVVRG
ncbi:MAG: acyl-ACP--UDP-N-acetylglucosamine O-acyltransferase [Muribaculaceae bacterium]|nr:acyl-ACP--UDP-N-acetylglucosamine O-acyltransferase [Muribaculaceae bacterium]